jgi:hypothetical protein
MKAVSEESEKDRAVTFVEGKDYYFEDGLMVLTAKFLSERGYCCGNDCRHCPYPAESRSSK